ncbi:hypothetical protein O6H91_06G093000 [Diphasiastrum complanatum]|uniref:Uncharacterized protein n=1 Tax=Diphasiastrum complanatum TaxID=34168 RepID=A0ACC2DG54_DIPCM|nr:hypothetical protein O6H91_06G093000 [Diphasiastrum complanatum]
MLPTVAPHREGEKDRQTDRSRVSGRAESQEASCSPKMLEEIGSAPSLPLHPPAPTTSINVFCWPRFSCTTSSQLDCLLHHCSELNIYPHQAVKSTTMENCQLMHASGWKNNSTATERGSIAVRSSPILYCHLWKNQSMATITSLPIRPHKDPLDLHFLACHRTQSE